ncbi:MAG: TonB-dependent receptor [Chitinophagales bacterium]|nr:TonB-dependent receptor [Chitinophagales bacterium]
MNSLNIKNIGKILFAIIIGLSTFQYANAQKLTIKGKVLDKDFKDPLIGSSVVVKDSDQGVITDMDGNFSIDVQKLPVTLLISYIGYESQEYEVIQSGSIGEILLSEEVLVGQEVVVTGSRVSERIAESPVTIQKMNATQIANAASGDFYKSMGNLQDVDITTSSLGFQIINTRGFNTTAPVRMVQFVDGIDNQAPGLNFPVGNLVGASDIDLASVELISGAASAMYGANAFQGVISMQSKDPFNYPGLQVKVKGGSRALFDGQMRYAGSFGKQLDFKKRFGYKVAFSYMRAKDWVADGERNRYGAVETDLRISDIVRGLQYSDDPEQAETFTKLNAYLDFYPNALPGILTVEAPGYMESELSDNNTKSLKASGAFYYNINDNIELSYLYKFGQGSAVYQGANRYNVKNITFQQHKIELKGKQFFVKAYTTMENSGDAYNIEFTGIGLSRRGFAGFAADYIEDYFNIIKANTNDFSDKPRNDMVLMAKDSAFKTAYASGFLKKGTPEFEEAYNEIVSNPDLNEGSRFDDKSSLQHVEGQYNFDIKKVASFNVGASYRNYHPASHGTIFRDTMRSDGKWQNLNTWETGGFIQGTFNLIQEKLKLIGSIRADKHMNFDLQWSPRVSAVFTHKGHTLRVSAQSAFRAPTLQDQYIRLNLGVIALEGNLNGVPLSYTLESVQDYRDYYDNTLKIRPDKLKTAEFRPLKHEQVKSIEFGYRGIVKNKLFIDFTAYFNQYKNFIGNTRLVTPRAPGVVGKESGSDQVLLGEFDTYQYAVNASQKVKTYGASVGLNYYFYKGLTANLNYTYSNIDTKDLTDPILPGFNTPRNKANIGISGQRVAKGFGFNANLKWVESFFWESPFGDGKVPHYTILDLNVLYEFDKFITLQVGGSNITNNKHIEAFGSPMIGGMVYASLLFDLERKGKR